MKLFEVEPVNALVHECEFSMSELDRSEESIVVFNGICERISAFLEAKYQLLRNIHAAYESDMERFCPELTELVLSSPEFQINVGSDGDVLRYAKITGGASYPVSYLGVVPGIEIVEDQDGYERPFLLMMIQAAGYETLPDGFYVADMPIRNVEVAEEHLPFLMN